MARTPAETPAVLLVLFEISAVIVLRAHYTMDVFTGLLAALCVATISEPVRRWIHPASSHQTVC